MKIKFSLIFLRAKLVLMSWMHMMCITRKEIESSEFWGLKQEKVFLSTAATFRRGIFKQRYPFLGVYSMEHKYFKRTLLGAAVALAASSASAAIPLAGDAVQLYGQAAGFIHSCEKRKFRNTLL